MIILYCRSFWDQFQAVPITVCGRKYFDRKIRSQPVLAIKSSALYQPEIFLKKPPAEIFIALWILSETEFRYRSDSAWVECLQKFRQLIKGSSIMHYSRLRICLYLLAAILCIGTFGYGYFESTPIFDVFYMTVITISTVGFSEVKPLSNTSHAITIIIIVSGITVLTYTLGQIFRTFLEGEMLRMLGRRKLEK